ncbi:MAG: hypothetical protein E5Y38_25205, partial [Mesorhizobium sp.]|uniref:hypothetical protein n=1 Tax=Mesorhizobium sp. TaxID=1871066 RepID=UPI0012040E4B
MVDLLRYSCLIGVGCKAIKPVKKHGEPFVNHFQLTVPNGAETFRQGQLIGMVVSHFLKWIDKARVSERAAAASALARAYINS